MSLRIATVQAEAAPGAIDLNLAKARKFISRAAAEGADIVVFPEAFVTGYDDKVFLAPLPTLADLTWLSPVQHVVDETGVVTVLNSALDRGGHRSLTDLVVTPGRPPITEYDKQHLYNRERAIFAAGVRGFSFTLKATELALSVCYDANFPEHAAAAAANGATVYINGGAYFPGGAHRRDLHHAARALDNGMYVVFSGLVGAPSNFIGGSAIFDPLGQRIAHVPTFEGIAIADLDPDVVAQARSDQRMWADRRASLGAHLHYGDLS